MYVLREIHSLLANKSNRHSGCLALALNQHFTYLGLKLTFLSLRAAALHKIHSLLINFLFHVLFSA